MSNFTLTLGGRREFQEGGDICIPMTDSCCLYGRN